MKGLHGIVPAVAILAILAAAGVGVGTPTALAEMQHRNVTQFAPGDLPYGIMRAGENIMGMYQSDKGAWNGELIRMREMERTHLQQRCGSNCTQQMQELDQEMNRIREQERIRQQTEAQQGYGSGVESQTRTNTETETQTGGSGTGSGTQGGTGAGSGTQGGTGTGSGTGSQGGR